MRGQLICIQTDGAISSAPITAPPSFTALRAIVQGYIECVPGFNSYEGQPCVAFCNEEGKLKGLPLNPHAQAYWQNLDDHLVGNIAVVTGDEELLEAL